MEKMLLNSGTTCLGAGVLALDPVPEEEVDGGGEDAVGMLQGMILRLGRTSQY